MTQQNVDSALTTQVKHHALHVLNADLIGIANIERFARAPLMMSPQGILPTARSVIVMAIHHPDVSIELGGEDHPQAIGPYCVQYSMNMRLDEMSYRLGRYIESLGYTAVPIVSSNIWRYKGYKGLNEHFAPDMSHLHAAVAAGLSEFGYCGLSITPEYGARQRYVSVITDAQLTPSPLKEPGTVCDDCMLCKKACPSGALSKELKGWNEVQIENYVYRYVNKNLWRCAWAEHFDLDLDLKIPETVDEQTILDTVRIHGRRGGEMGCCLKHCVPKARRYFDKAFCHSPRRRRDVVSLGMIGANMIERMRACVSDHGASGIIVVRTDQLTERGITYVANSKHYLPGAQCAVIVCLTAPQALVNDPDLADPGLALQTYSLSGGLRETANKLVVQAGYDVTRELERYGFDAVGATAIKESEVVAAIPQVPPGHRLFTYTVLTNAELPETCFCCPSVESGREQGSYLKAALMEEAQRLGADVCGVSSVSRLQRVADAIRPFYAGETVIVARDTADLFVPYKPDVHTRRRNVRDPSTVLNGAKSVFVFGIALPQGTVDITARTASDSVGPYAFALYENLNYLRRVALRLVQWLDRFGIKAYVSDDLLDAGSATASPRGEVPDLFSNRFEAFAAGLGRFAKAGYLVNEKYGTNVRYMALVIDCELAEDDYAATAITACKQCDEPCIRTCATKAFAESVTFSVDQITESFYRLDTKRCDWAKRYCLVASEGCGYTGWTLDLPVPTVVTEEEVAQGVAQQPPIPKYRPCNFEACAMACPLQRAQNT